MSYLKATNLVIGYKKPITEAISFSFTKGSFNVILGLNGSGKSTLLKTISRILNPLDGQIYIDSKIINLYSSIEFAKQVSIVLTDPLEISNLTVKEFISFGRQPYTNWMDRLDNSDIDHIQNAIIQCELKSIEYSLVDQISDGQRQRMLIARALAQNTPIILFDEPTSYLDLKHKVATFELLYKLAKKHNKIILISTHQVNLSLQLADQICLIQNNSLIQNSPKKHIESNTIQNLFESDLINFNKNTNQFIVLANKNS